MTADEISKLGELHEQGYVIRIVGGGTVAFREKGNGTAYVDGGHRDVGSLESIPASDIRVFRDVTAEVFSSAGLAVAMPGNSPSSVREAVREAVDLIREYASNRSKDVARGLETPRLAGLLVQKYALGVKDMFYAAHGDRSAVEIAAVREVAEAGDAAVESIDPNWREHGRQRWAAKPSDLAM